jgi:hypothetical protein
MTVDQLVREWRGTRLDALDPGDDLAAPEAPLTSVAVLDRELAPTRLDPWAGTCDSSCGDTCPPPFSGCNNTCSTVSNCCC